MYFGNFDKFENNREYKYRVTPVSEANRAWNSLPFLISSHPSAAGHGSKNHRREASLSNR